NVCTSQAAIVASNGESIIISLGTPISFPGLTSHTIGELLTEADERLVALESQQLKKASVQTQYSQIINAFDALNNGNIPGSSCPGSGLSLTTGSQPTGASLLSGAPEAEANAGPAIRLYAPSPNPFTGHTRLAYAVGAGGDNVDLAV